MGFDSRDYRQWKGSRRYKDWDESHRPRLQRCPLCGEKSLFWNAYDRRYECLNRNCQAIGSTLHTLSSSKRPPNFTSGTASSSRVEIAPGSRQLDLATANRVLRTLWKQLRGRLAPFRVKRAFKTFWNIFKRMLVVVVVLAVTALVVAAVCGIITASAKLSVGIILAVLGIGLLAWGVKSLSLHRLSFARAFMVVFILGLFVLASSAYLNVRSPTDIKDSVAAVLTGNTSQFRTSVDAFVGRVELKVVEVTSTSDGGTEGDSGKETEQPENTEHVYIDGGVLVGADGHWIVLHNNPNAENPTWEELKTFLLADKTDERPYNSLTFVCADFAEMVHNNAEAAGIRAAYVCVELGSCSYFPSGGGHALDAFNTTDRGLVYIDCTGCLGTGPGNCDKIVDVSLGKHYIPESIFPEPGWRSRWGDMGVVEEIETIQW